MTDCYDNSVTCCTIFCIISISNNYGPSDICLLFVFEMAEMPNSICTCIDSFAPDSHVFDRKRRVVLVTSRSHPRDPLDPSYARPRRLAIQYPLPLSSLHHQHLLFLTLPTHNTERGVRPLHSTLLPTASSGSDLPDKTTLRNERPHIPIVMSSTSANQDPALAPPPTATAPPAGAPATDPAASPHLLDSAQIVQLLRHFPSVYQVSHPSSFYILFPSPPPYRPVPAVH